MTTTDPDLDARLAQALETAQSGNVPAAIPMLREIVTTDPGFTQAWGHLGYLLLLSGRPSEAVSCYEQIVRLSPDDLEAVKMLGECYYVLGRRDRARDCFLKLEGTPLFENPGVRERISNLSPVHRRFFSRVGLRSKQFFNRLGDPVFAGRFAVELFRIPRAIRGIRCAGFSAYLTYLARHYLDTRQFSYPERPCDFCGGKRFTATFFYEGQKSVVCNRCGLEFVERKPPESLDVFSEWYDREDSIRFMEKNWENETFFRHRIDLLKKVFREAGVSPPSAGERAFEVGCGEGHLLRFLSDQGLETAGIETAPKLVRHCRNVMGLNVTHSTIRTLEEREGNWDYFLAYHVLEHLERPSELFSKAAKMVKPGGFLLVEVPIPDLPKVGLSQKLDPLHGYANLGHLHYFRPETLIPYFSKYGFTLAGTYRYHEETLPSGGFLGRRNN